MSSKKESKAKCFLPANYKPCNPHIAELQQTISQQVSLNKKKYDEILCLKPTFDYNLYKINQYQTLHKDFGKQLLIRQLDRLLEEENILDRQLSLIRFHDQETRINKQELAATGINSYEIIKNIWKGGSRTYSGAVEHVEELNNIVGHIRHNIKKLTQIETCALQEGDQYYLNLQQREILHPISCGKCKQTQDLEKCLRTQIASLKECIHNLSRKNEQCLQQIFKKDESIKQLSKKMLEMQAQSKIKISLLQEKWLFEDHQAKQLRKFKNDIERNSICNLVQGYQIYLKCEIDSNSINKETSLPLSKLIEIIAAYPPYNTSNQSQFPVKSLTIQGKINKSIIPQLQLQPTQSSPQNTNKCSFNDHPRSASRTERLITSINQKRLSKFQQMGYSSKYVRSNHITTKRNHRTVTCSQFDEDTYATEAIVIDSLQNIETQN